MIEPTSDHLLDVDDYTDYEVPPVIPAPRSGSSYELFAAEVLGYHGCLDAPIE